MDSFQNYIDGAWVDGPGKLRDENPSDLSDVIGEFASASADDASTASAAAKRAQPEWARTTVGARADALDRIGSEILARREELGRVLSREEGKTLPEGIGEATRAGAIFKFFAGEAVRLSGELVDSVRPGVEVETRREPVGVVGLITPWNFPLAIPAWKIAPALAFGNAVVFKPAELVPSSAWHLSEIISRAGLPAGAFNLVMGEGAQAGRGIVESRDVDAISFTGSVEVGSSIAQTAAQRRARVQLEMGGKNPLLVLDDADIDIAVACAIDGAYFSTGQRCTASSRLVVTDRIHDAFVAKLIERIKALNVGHALAEGTQVGPVVDQTQLDIDLKYIQAGKDEDAVLAYGGELLSRSTRGYYLQPALFTQTHPNMRINREEIFGPVASVIRVSDYEEGLRICNDTPFGLSAGIVTSSLKYATHFKRNAQAGMVMVNLPTAGVDYHVPFGGTKGSSYGPREQGAFAREFYTTVKVGYTRW